MYENYIFDLYGTLVDINTNEGEEGYGKSLLYFSVTMEPFISPLSLERLT